ncbi:unnamed protein product, partial [Owenia fusiformis]
RSIMESPGKIFALVLVVVLPVLIAGDTCLAPDVKSNIYTTTETAMSSQTVFIVEFSLACKNKLKNVNVYADLNGKTVPASRSGDKYQVSFSDEHKKLSSGTYTVRFFDEEGYAALRKAQRGGDDTSAVKPLFTQDVVHKGASSGQYVQSEFVATSAALLVFYFAWNARSNLGA